MIEFKISVAEGNNCEFTATEQGICLGKCTFILEGYYVTLSEINGNDEFTLEGLIRSCLNYAANRGAYIARADKSFCPEILRRMHFEGDDVLTSEIPEALMGSCCSH